MPLIQRLPRPIIALLAAFGLVAALQMGPLLAPAGSPLAPPSASAAVSTKICNSSDSTDLHRIAVIVIGGPVYYVGHGNCGPWLGNSSDQLRVNTCPDGNYISYYVIKSDSGYGPHHDGCNSNSNPPNYNGPVYYKMMN